MGNLIWSSSSHLNLKMLRFTLLLLLQLGVAHFQNCPLSKTFLQCDKGTGGRRFFGSDPTHWDPDTVIDAGMDQHYDCRACCRDESVCSIPQCDTGLTSPGCHMDQGPEIVDEDLPSPQVPRDWQDQGHFQNCPLSKTFLQCDKGTGGRRFFGSDPTHWDPDTVIDAGMDQHYDCRACCRDKSVCSIPQCDTGLPSPGCHMDQGPEIVDEDLLSPQVPRDWQDQGPALPRPSNIPVEHEIVDEDQHSRQVSAGGQDQGPEIVDEDLASFIDSLDL